MAERDEGFYWVRFDDGEWIPSFYNGFCWNISGDGFGWPEDKFAEIGEPCVRGPVAVNDARQNRIDAAARAALTGYRADISNSTQSGSKIAKEAYDDAYALEAERERRIAGESGNA